VWSFIDNIPEGSLESWYRWLTIFAIGLPIVGVIAGGVCGWGGFVVSNRIGKLQTLALNQAKEDANTANTRLQYWDVSRLNMLGVHFVGGDLVEHTGLNNIIGPYVRVGADGKFVWDCSPASIDAYSAAIKYDSKLPFAYFFRASCRRLMNDNDWHDDVDTSRSILIVTTQIPGHHVNHDEILKMIDNGNLGHQT
jgi:hypothetical protein